MNSTRICPEMWLAGRELSEPRQSPDGVWLAYVISWGGRSAIMVRTTLGDGPERMLSSSPEPRSGRGFGGGCLDWLPDGTGLLYAARDGGLWRQSLAGGPASCVVVADMEHPAQHPCVSPDGTKVAFVVDMGTIEIVALDDGRHWVVPTAADFVADPCWSADSASLVWQQWSTPSMAWDESSIGAWRLDTPGWAVEAVEAVEEVVAIPDRQVQQPRRDREGQLWSVRDDHGWLNVWRDDQPVCAEPFEHAGPTWGLGQRSYAVSPAGDQVAICRNERGFGRLIVVTVDNGEVREYGRGVHGQVEWRGDTITALRSGGRTPTQIVAYHATTGVRTLLAVGPIVGFDDSNLVEPELVSWPASEVGGDHPATIHGRLYRSERADGRLMCWIHGGPTDQWQVTFLPRLAYWIQQGWSILVPDHRGSTGHGRAYQQALRGLWGERDVADVAAGLATAHRLGWGRVEQTAVIGSSAGGFTVLNLCRLHPELIRAAVALYPVSDLAALDGGDHRFEAHYNATLVGVGAQAEERYRQRSPLLHATDIRVPLLLLHGTDDPVVPVAQSRQLADALVTAGADVDFVEYAAEGHGFRRTENQLDEIRRTTEFLRRHVTESDLGGV